MRMFISVDPLHPHPKLLEVARREAGLFFLRSFGVIICPQFLPHKLTIALCQQLLQPLPKTTWTYRRSERQVPSAS